jgi:hypothetical protein
VRKLLGARLVKHERASARTPRQVAVPVGDASSAGNVWTVEILSRQRALRAAILIDAVRCLIGVPGGRDRRARRAAARWVLSRDTKLPFSFYNVCESLGFDPSRVRRLLLMPCLETEGGPRLVIAEKRGGAVRRPRRDPGRYVVLHGGGKR